MSRTDFGGVLREGPENNVLGAVVGLLVHNLLFVLKIIIYICYVMFL